MSEWTPGDRAYCRHNHGARGIVEKGRVYTVEQVIPVPAHVGCGLALQEVAPPPPNRGFWSGRFVRLARGHSNLRQIDAALSMKGAAA